MVQATHVENDPRIVCKLETSGFLCIHAGVEIVGNALICKIYIRSCKFMLKTKKKISVGVESSPLKIIRMPHQDSRFKIV